jgi:hypothetical protein
MVQILVIGNPRFIEELATEKHRNWKWVLTSFVGFAWPFTRNDTAILSLLKAEFIDKVDFQVEVRYTPDLQNYGKRKFNPNKAAKEHLYRVLAENLKDMFSGYNCSICISSNENTLSGTYGIITAK